MKMNSRFVLGCAVLFSTLVLSFASVAARAQRPAPPPTYTNQYFRVAVSPVQSWRLNCFQEQNFAVTVTNTVSGSLPVTVNLSNIFGEAYSEGGVDTYNTMNSYVNVDYSTSSVTVSYGSPQRATLYLTDNCNANNIALGGWVQVYGTALVNGAPVGATANLYVLETN